MNLMKTKIKEQTKHTPGPWTINPEKQGGPWFCIEAGENGWVAQVPNPDCANAALIAAAPAMLGALRKIKSFSESSIEHGFRVDPAVFRDIAGNTIAAAEWDEL